MDILQPGSVLFADIGKTVATARLNIAALSTANLLLYLQGKDKFEGEFGLPGFGRVVSGDVREMVEQSTLQNIKDAIEADQVFYTFWVAIDRENNAVVAELGFKGPPNAGREIEVGYGTMPAFRNRGFMSEALGGILQWAAKREDVSAVLASIDLDNLASLAVVRNNGFSWYENKAGLSWWRKPTPRYNYAV